MVFFLQNTQTLLCFIKRLYTLGFNALYQEGNNDKGRMECVVLKKGMRMASNNNERYTANLYYHGRLEHQFSGNILNRLLTKLHLLVNSMRTGTSGNIVDERQNKIVHSCSYQASE